MYFDRDHYEKGLPSHGEQKIYNVNLLDSNMEQQNHSYFFSVRFWIELVGLS